MKKECVYRTVNAYGMAYAQKEIRINCKAIKSTLQYNTLIFIYLSQLKNKKQYVHNYYE